MQNTKLDSTVSVPDQELSSVEYIDARENSIATITRDGASVQDVEDPRSLQLIFGQKHNDIDCALCPTAKRACDRAWMTAKQIENLSKMSTMTLWRRLNKLEDVGRICNFSDMMKAPIQDSCGVPHETTLYNLNVLNQLAMVCIDNENLNEMSCKFSDTMSEVETTGGYGIRTVDDMINDPDTAIRLLTQLKIMRLQNDQLEMERDEAIRTKAMIGSRREATAMSTASAKARECEKLREQIGDSETYKRATAIPWLSEYFDTRNNGLYNSLAAQLKKIEASMPPEFAHKPTSDSRFGSVKAYHIAVIEKFHELVREKIPVDEKFMAKYRKDVSPKTKND